jgi:type IX secretion system PorP/SprF family membrane protein
MKKYIFLALAVLFLGNAGFAQQDPHYSQYMFNHLVLNPAYAGSWGYMTSNLLFRKQWVGFDGAPESQSFSLHAPSRNDRHGFGISAANDKIGVTQNTSFAGQYAFRIHLGENARLALGLQAEVENYRGNFGDVRTGSTITGIGSDPAFTGNSVNWIKPNAGAGLFFHTKHFYLGASAPRLIEQNLSNSDNVTDAMQRRHFFFTTGLVFGKESATLKFKPSVLLKYVAGAPLNYDINAQFLIADRIWLGASYRSEDAIVGMVQVNVLQWLRIGYAYDHVTSEINPYAAASHEFLLGVDLNFKKKGMISPRYF